MPITIHDVEHIATLAKLEFSQAEKHQLVADLNAMLERIDRLNEVDTAGVEPLEQIGGAGSALRADDTQPSTPQNDMLANAPDCDGPLFRVPKAFERKRP